MTSIIFSTIMVIFRIVPIFINTNIYEYNHSSIVVSESGFNSSEPIIVMNEYSDIYFKKKFADYPAKEKEIYYFVDSLFNTKSLKSDTLVLDNDKINKKSPWIEFHSDSKFRIIYDIKHLTVSDTESGTQLLVQKSKEIKGTYSIEIISKEQGIVNDEYLKLKIDNGESFHFKVIEKNNRIYWISNISNSK